MYKNLISSSYHLANRVPICPYRRETDVFSSVLCELVMYNQ